MECLDIQARIEVTEVAIKRKTKVKADEPAFDLEALLAQAEAETMDAEERGEEDSCPMTKRSLPAGFKAERIEEVQKEKEIEVEGGGFKPEAEDYREKSNTRNSLIKKKPPKIKKSLSTDSLMQMLLTKWATEEGMCNGDASNEEDLAEMEERVPEPSAELVALRKSTGEVFKMENGDIFGKSDEATHTIDGNETISRKHVLIKQSNGSVYIKDMGSLNGTRINGQLIDSGVNYEILKGDTLILSDEVFLIERRGTLV